MRLLRLMRHTSLILCAVKSGWSPFSTCYMLEIIKSKCLNLTRMLRQRYFIKLMVIKSVAVTCQKHQPARTADVGPFGPMWLEQTLLSFSQDYEVSSWFTSSLCSSLGEE